MKIYLDENLNILSDDGNNIFGKGNNYFDFIDVYILTSVVSSESVLPVFNFMRPDGKVIGSRVPTDTRAEEDYTIFTYKMEDVILAIKGVLTITIVLNFYNENLKVISSKHLTVLGNVLNNVTVNDAVFILTENENAEEILIDVLANVDALNKTVSEKVLFEIDNVTATVDANVGTPAVEVVKSGEEMYPSYAFNFSNIKGEQGIQGVQGLKGDKGDKGDDGVYTELPTGFFSLNVDEETGEVYVLTDDTDKAPVFEYDAETGHLYIVQTNDGYLDHLTNGDDLEYGN